MKTLVGYARASWRMLRFLLLVGRASMEARSLQGASQERRSVWMRSLSERALRILQVHITVEGDAPARGMLVSNHLGYLDVLVYGAVIAPVFLSKAEVADWPVLGPLCRATGALFVQRESRAAAVQAQQQLADVLRTGLVTLVFPEGTSTAGENVLPFHAPMFQAAVQAEVPVHTATIVYRLPDVPAETARTLLRERVFYWGDMTIGPHIFGLMQLPRVDAAVVFLPAQVEGGDRRTLANNAHAAVAQSYAALTAAPARP